MCELVPMTLVELTKQHGYKVNGLQGLIYTYSTKSRSQTLSLQKVSPFTDYTKPNLKCNITNYSNDKNVSRVHAKKKLTRFHHQEYQGCKIY